MKVQYHTPTGIVEVEEESSHEKAKKDIGTSATANDKINVILKYLKLVD